MSIYDCFTFFNELELLNIRLEILDPYVDFFVIVELSQTHRGKPKPYHFEEHREEFAKYLNKIIYIQPAHIPPYGGEGDWTIESFQRDCIQDGLNECLPDDIILISDLDEIPAPHILSPKSKGRVEKNSFLRSRNLRKLFHRRSVRGFLSALWGYRAKHINEFLEYFPIVCEQDLYYYFLNCRSRGKWHGTIMTKYKNLTTPQDLRNQRGDLPYVQSGGWHFSYIGGTEQIKAKLNSIIDSGSDINRKMRQYASDEDYIENCLSHGIDLYGRTGAEYTYDFVEPDQIGIPHVEAFRQRYPKLFRQ